MADLAAVLRIRRGALRRASITHGVTLLMQPAVAALKRVQDQAAALANAEIRRLRKADLRHVIREAVLGSRPRRRYRVVVVDGVPAGALRRY
ncbi:hypothetical protein ACIRU3_19765 [Streptomyces sp. NPDC101151]|uniref:hypothetical protein n=1 Tax=Streptomyces sp. NPDC101151 TaxID=3366115 RepID=UPI003818D021